MLDPRIGQIIPYIPAQTDSHSQPLMDAIKRGEYDRVKRLLDNTNYPNQSLIEAALLAQSLDKFQVVQLLLSHRVFTPYVLNDLFPQAVEFYDSQYRNLAMEMAKKIDHPLLRKETIALVEIAMAEKGKAAFKINSEKQFGYIREQMELAIDQLSKDQKPTSPRELTSHVTFDLQEMESIFKASEELLLGKISTREHPLFKYFEGLSEGDSFDVTLISGSSVQDFTTLMLGKHGLQLEKANQPGDLKLDIFNGAQSFMRCRDIFKAHFEKETEKTIECELSYSSPKIPVDVYCKDYIAQNPELAAMDPREREKYIRLLSVFNVDKDIAESHWTFKMSVKEISETSQRSFEPIPVQKAAQKKQEAGSNEISFSQLDLTKQIQNLEGSELSMVRIKAADGEAQFKALESILDRKDICMVDIGGGRGETNAVPKALQESGVNVNLLNIEPFADFARPYIEAHQLVGVQKVQVLELKTVDLTTTEVTDHFHGKVDVVLNSHAAYFDLSDMHKATQEYIHGDPETPLQLHPMYKYFDMMREDGVLVLTMQSGAGARLFRNALMGEHRLGPGLEDSVDEAMDLLSCFGNVETFLRNFEVFTKRYEEKTGKKIEIKFHHAVANVPLGDFRVEQDPETGSYILHNPNGADNDPNWIAPTMFNFYGNWKELHTLATLTPQSLAAMTKKQREGLKIKTPELTPEQIEAKRAEGRKKQEIFLHILRAFAPAEQNMQHPNITLEISVK